MKIGRLTHKNLPLIKPLIVNYKFNEHRGYPIFNEDISNSYLTKQIADSLTGRAEVFLVIDKRAAVGLCALKKLPLESKIFNFKMAELAYLMTGRDYTKNLKINNSLTSFILELCKKNKISHLSCRIDTSDSSAIHALEASGFKIMDTVLTYGYRSKKYTLPKVKDFWTVRKFRQGDCKVLIDIAWDAFLKSRFYIDIHTRKNAGKFYTEWVKKCCDGSWADNVIVAEKKGVVAGFITYKLDKNLHDFTGIKIAGRGLLAVSSKVPVPGLSMSLLRAWIRETKEIRKVDEAELDTQINNFPVIRMYQKLCLQILRARHTLHKWLD